MTHKRIGYYPDTTAPASITGADQLLVEIGCNQVVILVKGQLPKQPEAFEMFEADAYNNDWTDILSDIKKGSQLLNRKYQTVAVHYNLPEALVIPGAVYNKQSGEDFLDQMYGDNSGDPSAHDDLVRNSVVVAYRIKKVLSDWIHQEFPSHKSSHLYTGMLDDLLNRSLPAGNFVAIRFYTKHLVVAVLKENKLQLIQSFNYEVDEDILYYLLNLIQQFELDPSVTQAEITGQLDKRSGIALQLPELFQQITWDESGDTGIFMKVRADHPAHYFTSYYKMGV